jgi:HEAT repeat protein/putative zinc finger protein
MMRCETNREHIVLMIHGELADQERRALEAHLPTCNDCSAALAEERGLIGLIAGAPEEGPSTALLRRCRDDLRRAIAAEAPAAQAGGGRPGARWWSPRLSPAWALALLAAGILVGRAFPSVGLPTHESAGTIANVDFHESDPLTDRVSLTYDTLRRTAISGTPSDPRIRRVLVDTVRDSRNAGLRLMALDVLRPHTDDRDVRAALLRTVREDDNAGARLKALEALQEHAADDPEVRGAIVEALVKDTNPGVRVRAIDALERARAPETLAVLRRLADQDPNEYVRLRSAALVSEMLPQGDAR